MRSRFRLFLATGALCSSSLLAHANDAPVEYPACKSTPTKSERKGAQGAFAAGEASFKEADYATAIVYWHDAYRRDCTAHALLRNLATAYELLGDRPAAIHALETFLARQPKDPEASAIQRRIDNLKEQLAPAPAPAPTPASSAQEPSSSTLIARPARVEPEPAGPPPETDEISPKRSLTPWIVTGAGGAAAIAGTVVFFVGKSQVDDAEAACPSRKCPSEIADKGNSGRTLQTTGVIVGGVGLAAAAGGVVWGLMFNEPKATETGTAIEPSFGPGFAGVNVATRF